MKYSYYISENELSKSILDKIKKDLNNDIFDDVNPEFIFVIGGDGTYLRAVRKYLNIIDKVIFISINTGNLGFYSNVNVNDVNNIKDIINSKLEIVEHDLIKFKINNKKIDYAINEVAIYSVPFIGKYKIYIDNNYLEEFAGNGLLISTQTGSTGLNKSFNGSIIDEKIHAMQLTEMAGIQSNAYSSLRNSIILDSSRVIKIVSLEEGKQILSYDTEKENLDNFNTLEVKYSNIKTKNLKLSKKDFLERVQKSFLK